MGRLLNSVADASAARDQDPETNWRPPWSHPNTGATLPCLTSTHLSPWHKRRDRMNSLPQRDPAYDRRRPTLSLPMDAARDDRLLCRRRLVSAGARLTLARRSGCSSRRLGRWPALATFTAAVSHAPHTSILLTMEQLQHSSPLWTPRKVRNLVELWELQDRNRKFQKSLYIRF